MQVELAVVAWSVEADSDPRHLHLSRMICSQEFFADSLHVSNQCAVVLAFQVADVFYMSERDCLVVSVRILLLVEYYDEVVIGVEDDFRVVFYDNVAKSTLSSQ